MTAGAKVLLMADTFDFDGEVNAVRFYGNGDDLGVQIRKVLDTVIVTKGKDIQVLPISKLKEEAEQGAVGVAQLVPPAVNGQGQPQNNPRGLASILISDPGFGYFMAPNVITGGGGTGAKASADYPKPL